MSSCLASCPTPNMWVIHTGLVIRQSDEGGARRSLVNQVPQDFMVVDF